MSSNLPKMPRHRSEHKMMVRRIFPLLGNPGHHKLVSRLPIALTHEGRALARHLTDMVPVYQVLGFKFLTLLNDV